MWQDTLAGIQQFIAERQLADEAQQQQDQQPMQSTGGLNGVNTAGLLGQLPQMMAMQGGGGGGGHGGGGGFSGAGGSGPLNLETEHGVTGNARAMSMLERVAQQFPQLWKNVESDYRTRAEQARLYQAYKNGTGNLAAPPGHSMHEQGLAFDINAGWIDSRPGLRQLLDRLGGFPVGGEPWHWQPRWTM